MSIKGKCGATLWSLRGKAARVILPLCLVAWPADANNKTPVHIELLLALDTSASVSRAEFELQLKGIAQAFRDPDVLQAVENLKPLGVAVGMVQWGGPGETKMIHPFTHLETAQDAKAFGFMVGRTPRIFSATSTSIVTAITDGIDILNANAFDGQRNVIDVSGDGEDNSGLSLRQAQLEAQAAGVTVNGLAIEADEAGLTQYYRFNVISGSDSFVVTARDFDDFARAMVVKLVRELRPLGS
jgi:hypothetical protein